MTDSYRHFRRDWHNLWGPECQPLQLGAQTQRAQAVHLCIPFSATHTISGTGQLSAAIAAPQLCLELLLPNPLHDLLDGPCYHEKACRPQQYAIELIPVLRREMIQRQRLAREQKADDHKDVGKDGNKDGDYNHEVVAARAQAMGPCVYFEAHDLTLQDVVGDRPSHTDNRVLQQTQVDQLVTNASHKQQHHAAKNSQPDCNALLDI